MAKPELTYFYNGTILTMNRRTPQAPHMLVAEGKVWHCSEEEAPLGLDYRAPDFETTRQQMSRDVEFVDLGGQTVMPGVCDAHAHFLWWGNTLAQADLSRAKSEAECLELLKTQGADGDGDGWVLGHGWAHNLWQGSKLPTRESLDAAFPDRPVLLDSKCGHLAWVNTRALQLAGVPEDAADPEGGEFERAGGRLTGILKETACSLVSKKVGPLTEKQRFAALEKAQKKAHALGITAMQTPEDLETWHFLQRAHAQGLLTMRVNFWMPVSALDDLCAAKITHGLGDHQLRISAIKIFTDGSLGGRTALMYDAYENEPANLGVEVTDVETITAKTLQANRAGLSMAIHAIGDRAVGHVLTAYEKAAAELGTAGDTTTNPVLRNRIEHLQVYSDRDRERIRALKPVASMQPIHLCADMGPADRHWGSRAKNAYACRTLTDSGCLLVFGSDVPVEPCNPFWGMYAAATRNDLTGAPGNGWNPEEKLSMQEILEAYTLNPAIAAGEQNVLGSLEPGKLADFIILPENPLKVTAEELKDMTPVATYIEGKLVYEDAQRKAAV